MASYRNIEVKPIAWRSAPRSAASISKRVDDETFAEIQAAWLEHLVVFFRDQRITPSSRSRSPSASARSTITLS